MEALRVVHAASPQSVHDVSIRDKFCHGFHPHALGDSDDRFDDELVFRIGAKASDEVAIDLEIVEREVLEVIERAESRAKIVQRKTAPSAPQLRRERLRVLDVANRRRFGQLEDQARGVDVCCRNPARR